MSKTIYLILLAAKILLLQLSFNKILRTAELNCKRNALKMTAN